MNLRKPLLQCALVASLAAASTLPADAAPWVRSFVVGSYEYAFHYGGRAGYVRDSDIEPGVDCPHGNTIYFAGPTQTRVAISRQSWRSQKEIDSIIDPPGLDTVRDPSRARITIWNRAIAYRGYKRGIETYINPFAADDPGQPEVTGRIGDGFNLDGKVKASDFVSTDGEMGIDNALYRAWGCDAPWRGDGNATLDLRANDKMQEGLYTIVIRISGNKDPMNDDNATVEIGPSPEKIIKDALGSVALDYSYRIVKSGPYTKLKARIKDGVVDTEQVPVLHAPRLAWFYSQIGDANFHNGRIRLNIAADGRTGTGLMGGYRDWRDLYADFTFAQDAGGQGIREHDDHVALYFAAKRNADGPPDPKTGERTEISTAYRLKLFAAIVQDTDKPQSILVRNQDERGKRVQEALKAAFMKSITTLTPQEVAPGNGEAAFPAMERAIVDLPSRDYFIQTLDRPRYKNDFVDERGNLLDPQGNARGNNVAAQ